MLSQLDHLALFRDGSIKIGQFAKKVKTRSMTCAKVGEKTWDVGVSVIHQLHCLLLIRDSILEIDNSAEALVTMKLAEAKGVQIA